MGISIHEAARASTLKKRMLCGLYGFQSTKPQGLRPGMDSTPLRRVNISIHEAARASTAQIDRDLAKYRISIHEAARASTGSR